MADRNERRSNWKNGHTMITITIWQFKKAFCALCHGSIKKKVTLPFCTIGLHMTPFPNLNGGNHQSVNFLFTQRIFGFISENVKKNVRRHL